MDYLILLMTVLASIAFSYSAGKKVEKGKHSEDLIDAITNAKKARAKLSDPDYVKWLRNRKR